MTKSEPQLCCTCPFSGWGNLLPLACPVFFLSIVFWQNSLLNCVRCFSYLLRWVEVICFYSWVSSGFYHKQLLGLVTCCSGIYRDDQMIFLLYSVQMGCCNDWFSNVKTALLFWDNPTWIPRKILRNEFFKGYTGPLPWCKMYSLLYIAQFGFLIITRNF